MTNATAYIPTEIITITDASNRIYDSVDFETNNLDYVKVEFVRDGVANLLVRGTDYTISALDTGYKFRVRITLTNAPVLNDELRLTMNAPLSASVDFLSPDVARIDFNNMQRSVEQAAAQAATVSGSVENKITDGDDALRSYVNTQLAGVREKDREQDAKINDAGTKLVSGKVNTTQKTFFHDPNRINGDVGVPMYRIIDILKGSDAAAKRLYTERQAGSFVSADDFMPLTTEDFDVNGETHEALVATFPGNILEYTYLIAGFNDSDVQIQKSELIPIATIANGFDWVMSDARAQENDFKREVRVRIEYDEVTNISKVKFHKERVPGTRDASTAVYLFTAFLVKETNKALLLESLEDYYNKAESDANDAATLQAAKEYTDANIGGDFSAYSTTAEIDAKDAVNLQAAKDYADTEILRVESGGTLALDDYYTKTESDANTAITLQAAEDYTFSQAEITSKDNAILTQARAHGFSQAQVTQKDADVLAAAKADATTKDSVVLAAANRYTDNSKSDPLHFVRVVRKEGISISDKDYYVENVAEIVQQDEFYIVNPALTSSDTIPSTEAGKFAIKGSDGTITYTAPVNGDTAHVYADRQVDITDGDGNVLQSQENRIVAVLIYEGQWIITNSYFKNANNVTETGAFANAEGGHTTASGDQSHAEGRLTTASGINSHAEGRQTTASDAQSHAEGRETTASGENSHAEGMDTTASGRQSHAEGTDTTASGENSHAEGNLNTVKNDYAHIQGRRGVLAHPDTIHAIAYGDHNPTTNEKAGVVDVGLVYKVDKTGNSTQTGKVKAASFEKTDGTVVEPITLPNPGNANGSRDLVSVVRNSSGKLVLVDGASTDVTGLLDSLSTSAPNSQRFGGHAIKTGTIPEDRLAASVVTKLNAEDGGANKAIEALASDMEWETEVQTYNNASVPTSPATIGLGYRIFAAGASNESHRIDFIFPTATSKADIDALVLNRKFVIEVPEGVITLEPTSHVATAVVSGGFHRERYDGDITPSFSDFTNTSDGNNDYQTTLYRGLESGVIADGSITTPKIAGAAVTEVKLSADVISKLNASASAFSGHGIVLTRLGTPALLTSSTPQAITFTLPAGKNIRDYDRILFKMTSSGIKGEYFARGLEIDSSTSTAQIVLAGLSSVAELKIYSPSTNNITITNVGGFTPNILAEIIAVDFTGEKGETPSLADYRTNAQIDAKDAVTLTSARSYADTQDNSHSTADRAYADAQDDAHSTADRAFTYSRSVIDSKDAATLTTAKTYTDDNAGDTNHFVRVVRKEGTIFGDKDYYVENTAEIVQQDEYYIVNPFVSQLGNIPDAEAGKYAIKNGSTITYTAPENGDTAFVYADNQEDDHFVENKIIAILIYENGLGWVVTNSFFKNARNVTETGFFANAEGENTTASARNSHAEGKDTTASGLQSHAEGDRCVASARNSHAEGQQTTASGINSHAEGQQTTASGNFSHAEGQGTTAGGAESHAEGLNTDATGRYSHAEGWSTTASGSGSHAEGYNTTAKNDYTTISGRNGVVAAATTIAGIGWGSSTPSSSQRAGSADVGLVWKADQSGNTTQTGTVTATDFVKADGSAIGGGGPVTTRVKVGVASDWTARASGTSWQDPSFTWTPDSAISDAGITVTHENNTLTFNNANMRPYFLTGEKVNLYIEISTERFGSTSIKSKAVAELGSESVIARELGLFYAAAQITTLFDANYKAKFDAVINREEVTQSIYAVGLSDAGNITFDIYIDLPATS